MAVQVIFCLHQMYGAQAGEEFDFDTTPLDPRAVLVCTAYSAENRIFQCPYNSREIYEEGSNGALNIAHRDKER